MVAVKKFELLQMRANVDLHHRSHKGLFAQSQSNKNSKFLIRVTSLSSPKAKKDVCKKVVMVLDCLLAYKLMLDVISSLGRIYLSKRAMFFDDIKYLLIEYDDIPKVH
jgi:hypothetical protein